MTAKTQKKKQRTVVIDDDVLEDAELPDITKPKRTTSSVTREHITKFGIIDKCKGLNETERGWNIPIAHSSGCRQRITIRMLEAAKPSVGGGRRTRPIGVADARADVQNDEISISRRW